MGKVVLLESLSEDYLEVLAHARRTGCALHLSEEQCLGFTHVDVGALLAARWQLPEDVATSIQYHHGPTEKIRGEPAVAVVAIADQIAYRAQSSTFESAAERLATLAHQFLGVPREEFEKVLDVARHQAPGVEVL